MDPVGTNRPGAAAEAESDGVAPELVGAPDVPGLAA
jgi:hypothetical protein